MIIFNDLNGFLYLGNIGINILLDGVYCCKYFILCVFFGVSFCN